MQIKVINTDVWELDAGYKSFACVPRALSIAAKLEFNECCKFLSNYGFIPGEGIDVDDYSKHFDYMFGKHTKPDGIRIKDFLVLCPKGRYIVRKSGHVFAVIDGKIFDHSENFSLSHHFNYAVDRFWKVEI